MISICSSSSLFNQKKMTQQVQPTKVQATTEKKKEKKEISARKTL